MHCFLCRHRLCELKQLMKIKRIKRAGISNENRESKNRLFPFHDDDLLFHPSRILNELETTADYEL